jgi:hypothetical protein
MGCMQGPAIPRATHLNYEHDGEGRVGHAPHGPFSLEGRARSRGIGQTPLDPSIKVDDVLGADREGGEARLEALLNFLAVTLRVRHPRLVLGGRIAPVGAPLPPRRRRLLRGLALHRRASQALLSLHARSPRLPVQWLFTQIAQS